MTTQIRVSHVAGLIDVEHVQPGWLIRRRGMWCEVSGVKRTNPGWRNVFVREYMRPMEFTIGTAVEVMAPVAGTERPPFLTEVVKVKVDDMVFPAGSTVVPQVEPYPGDKRDGKLYITQDQAALLAELIRTYFPADFENYETGRFVKSLTGVLTSFAGSKR